MVQHHHIQELIIAHQHLVVVGHVRSVAVKEKRFNIRIPQHSDFPGRGFNVVNVIILGVTEPSMLIIPVVTVTAKDIQGIDKKITSILQYNNIVYSSII
jgi:hypothetical protein